MTENQVAERATDDVGTGEPALLFLPGWCGDRSVFDGLTERTGRHRRALAVDLRGHGGHPHDTADFTTADVVSDVVEQIERAGIGQVVLVALSHAGWVAIEVRRRLGPDRVRGLVLLDWMVLGPPPGFTDALAGLQQPASWEQVRAGLFGMWTTGVDVPALHDYVTGMGRYGFAHWRRAGREIAAAFAAAPSPLAKLDRLEVPCPTLHLYAQPADDAVLEAQREYGARHPWFRAHRLPASSHFPMFEVPDEMSRVIEGFARDL